MEFPVELTGFATAEIDIILDTPELNAPSTSDPADIFTSPDRDAMAVSRAGDCWLLGRHRLVCGNSLEQSSYELVLGNERAKMIITEQPYNVSIRGHVSGSGKVKHREFVMASGEMSAEEFTSFLRCSMGHTLQLTKTIYDRNVIARRDFRTGGDLS